MIDIKNIILNKDIRNDILQYHWSRKESIKYNKLKYITKPYTSEDLDLAIQYNSYDCVVKFLDKLILNTKIDNMIINQCNSLRVFQYIYNYFTKIYDTEHIHNLLRTEIYVSKGLTDIINFIYDEGYTITVEDINSAEMCELVINKCKVDYKSIPISNFGCKALIYLYENEFIEYELEDSILDGNIDMIDYFLDEIETIPTTSQICDLISLNYERIDLIRNFDTTSDIIAMNAIENGDMNVIETLINSGFCRDEMISYCMDRGYEDMEELLYNY